MGRESIEGKDIRRRRRKAVVYVPLVMANFNVCAALLNFVIEVVPRRLLSSHVLLIISICPKSDFLRFFRECNCLFIIGPQCFLISVSVFPHLSPLTRYLILDSK